MNGTTLSKTDFIKFNVSPTFKALAQKKARASGMTLSELGRMLFGAFVSNLFAPPVPKKLLQMAEEAKRAYKAGKTKSFKNIDDMMVYLDSI